jgi:predicted RNA-binding protein with TRAM domain
VAIRSIRIVEISDKLLCLFSADVSAEDDKYVIEVPRREIDTGSVEPGGSYRVALVSRAPEPSSSEGTRSGTESTSTGSRRRDRPASEPQPPVEAGEMRYVEIEDIGKQGDGIARVERGYVIIVPQTEIGERVKIEISEVKSNFAVGDVVDD